MIKKMDARIRTDLQQQETELAAIRRQSSVQVGKQKMRDAANKVELSIDKDSVKSSTGGGTTTEPDEDQTENPLG